jgi:hypothetical protein
MQCKNHFSTFVARVPYRAKGTSEDRSQKSEVLSSVICPLSSVFCLNTIPVLSAVERYAIRCCFATKFSIRWPTKSFRHKKAKGNYFSVQSNGFQSERYPPKFSCKINHFCVTIWQQKHGGKWNDCHGILVRQHKSSSVLSYFLERAEK